MLHLLQVQLDDEESLHHIVKDIAGGDHQVIKLYGGKVYVAGGRATDDNTIWKLDAALGSIEADYDTGPGTVVNDLRILSDGTIYAVGTSGTNEDAQTGNVNVFDSDLVRSATYNIRTAADIEAIAERQ